MTGTTITGQTQAHAAGAVDVVVTAGAQSATLAGAYTFVAAPPPTITGISPNNGSTSGNTLVTVSGSGFASTADSAANATITVGGIALTSATISGPTSLSGRTAEHAAGAVDVVVTNPDGQSATLSGGFTYTVTPVTISSISPVSGTPSGGTSVTIAGTGFLSGATVAFGGTPMTSPSISSGSISGSTPAHTAGVVDVVVTNPDGGSATKSSGYTYAILPPTISSISPSSGTASGGTSVTIFGTGFLPGATVTFGGISLASSFVVDENRIFGSTPSHAAGAVAVVVTNFNGQSVTLNGGYTYVVVPPTVSLISPASGSIAGGTSVTILGTGFSSGLTVSLGGTPLTSVSVSGTTSITGVTGAHAAGAVDVVVTNSDSGSTTLTSGYIYVP